MIQKSDFLLVIGAGSIGERYIRNLWKMGFRNIVVLRSRNLPMRDISDAKVRIVTSWEEVESFHPAAAFVCTPTSMHLRDATTCVLRGIHVLVEKPLSDSTDGLQDIETAARKNNVIVQVGYMMRYHPLLKKVHTAILENTYGKLIHIKSHWGEYLPDWHPWEDYRDSYAARRALGGGVALTLSHDLDLSNWLAGSKITRSVRAFNFRSSLEVDVEAGADFLIEYKNGVTANVHVNYFQKVKERTYQYIFEEAVIVIDYFKNEMIVRKTDSEQAEVLDHFDRNDLFIEQINVFLNALTTPESAPDYISESRQIINLCKIDE